MADAVIYSSLDPAGPGLRPQNGTENASLSAVSRTFAILHACLVTGYGSGASAKPGQGWVLVHADLPNGFTLRAPDGVFYIFCRGPSVPTTGTGQGSSGCQVYMAEALAAPYTYPPTGPSVRSGDYASSNPGDANRHWITFSSSPYQETKWFLIARGSQVLFFRDSYSWESTTGESAGSASNLSSASIFLGNILLNDPAAPRSGPQCSLVQGGYINANTGSSTQSLYSNHIGDVAIVSSSNDSAQTSSAASTRLRDFISGVAETGALTKVTCNPTKHAQVVMSRAPMLAFPADLKLDPVDVWINATGSVGKVPGLFHGGRSCHYRTMDLLVALGKGASITECLTPVTIDGEPFYIIPTGYGSVIVSLLEKYWS